MTTVLALNSARYATLPGVRELLFDRSFTVECWIKLDSTQADQTILGTDETGQRQGLHLVIRGGRVYCGFYAVDTGGSTVLSTGVWTHVAFTYDKAGQRQEVYVNGVLDGSGANKPSWIGGTEVLLGRWENNRYFNGHMAELRIWDHTRDANAIAGSMNQRASGAESGLVALYRLDEGEGTRLDELIAGQPGALVTAGWANDTLPLGAASPVNWALSLRADASPRHYAALPDTIAPLLHDRSFTVECWVELHSLDGVQTVLGNDSAHGQDLGLLLGVRDGRVNCGFWNNDLVGATTLTVGSWTHLAFVYDASSQTQRVYIDGVLDGERANAAAWIGAAPIRLGRTAGTYYFDGRVRELRIWDRARSASDIAATFGRRLSGAETGLAAYYPLDDGPDAPLHERSEGADGTLVAGAWVVETLSLDPPAPTQTVLAVTPGQYAVLPGIGAHMYDRSFTVEAWIKLDLIEGHRSIIGSWKGEARKAFFLGVIDGRVWQSYYGDDTIGVQVLSPEVWTHVAYTYDAATATPRIYVNGVLDREGSPKPTWIGTEEVRLGIMGGERPFSGRVRELRVWDSARTRGELLSTLDRRLSGLEAGLTAHYPLDDSGGTQLRELIGGAPGELEAGEWVEDPDLPLLLDDSGEYALGLQGNQHGVLPGVQALLYDRSFTVEVWLWPAKSDAGPYLGTDVPAARQTLVLQVAGGRANCTFWGNNNNVVGETVLELRRWTHVAFVYDATAQTQTIYVNGAVDGSQINRESWIGTEDVLLGRRTVSSYFDGRLSELRIWDHARTRREINVTLHRRLGSGVPGLRRVYPLDSRSGTAILELVEDSEGTLTGGTWLSDPGLVFQPEGTRALALTDEEFAVLPGVQKLLQARSFTVEAWIWLDAIGGTRTILGTDSDMRVRVSDNGRLSFGFREGEVHGTTVLSTQTWTHVAATYDQYGGKMRVYVNGVDDGGSGGGRKWHGTADVLLGRGQGGNYLGGRITELRIWDHVRNQNHLQGGLGHRLRGDESGLAAYYPLDLSDAVELVEKVHGTPGRMLSGGRKIVDRTLSLPTADPTIHTLAFGGSEYGVLPGVQAVLYDRSFTIEAWVWIDSSNPGEWVGSEIRAFRQGLGYGVHGGRLVAYFYGTHTDVHGATAVPIRGWFHTAFVYDMDSQTQKIYLNGSLDGVAVNRESWIGTTQVHIGWSVNHASFNGRISELRFWQGLRSEDEIRANMRKRLRGDEPALERLFPLDASGGPTIPELSLAPEVNLRWLNLGVRFPANSWAELQDVQGLLYDRSYTVECWVKPFNQNPEHTLLGTMVQESRKGLHLMVRNNRFYFGHYGADTIGTSHISTSWSHVAFVYDRAAQTQKIYVDGNLDGEGAGKPSFIGTTPVHIGTCFDGGRWLDGTMTELRIWNHARSQADIQANKFLRMTGTEAGLASVHSLSMGVLDSGVTVYDLARNAHGQVHGPIEGFGLESALLNKGSVDLAGAADGTLHPSDCLELPSGHYGQLPIQDVLHDRSFTIELWLRLSAISGGDLNILRTPEGQVRKGLHLIVRDNRLYMGFYFGDSAATTRLPTGNWVHAAFVYDKDSQTQAIYLDGELEVQNGGKASWIGTLDPWLGDGSIHSSFSELRVWDHPRTQAELRANMRERLTGLEPGLARLYPLAGRSAQAGKLYEAVQGRSGRLVVGGVWRDDRSLPVPGFDPHRWVVESGHPMTPGGSGTLELDANSYGVLPGVQAMLYDRSYTVECWVKLTRNDGHHMILGSMTSEFRKGLHLMIYNGPFQFGHYGNGTSITGATTPPTDTWIHVAFVYDRNTQTQRIYLDGVLDGEGGGKPSYIGTTELQLGRGLGERWLEGRLRELRIWSYARSEFEIRSTMNAGLRGSEGGLLALYPLDSNSGSALIERVSGRGGSLVAGGSWVEDDELELEAFGPGSASSSPVGGGTERSSLGDPPAPELVEVVPNPPQELDALGTLSISVFFVSFDIDLPFEGDITVEPFSLATTYTGSVDLGAPFNVEVGSLTVAIAGGAWMVEFGEFDGLVALYDSLVPSIPEAIAAPLGAILRPYVELYEGATIILSNAEGESETHGGYLGGFNVFTESELALLPPFSLLDEALRAADGSLGLPSIPVSLGMGLAAGVSGDFFVSMAYAPNPRLTLIPGLLEFSSVSLDVRKQTANLSAGAQLEFALMLGSEELRLRGGLSGQSSGEITVWGALDAADGAWNRPFGIEGLTIVGMGLEVGFTTEFPWIVLGVRGEASIGDDLLGARIGIKIDAANVANLVLDVYSVQGIRLPALIDAMTGFDGGGLIDVSLTELQLYYSPNGGTIAGQDYAAGLAVSGHLDLWGFEASVDGELDYDNGGHLRGQVDRISLASSGVTLIDISDGNGGGANLDLEFTGNRVGGTIDGELSIAGGVYESTVHANLSTSGFSIALSGGAPGIYQNAQVVAQNGTYSFAYGPEVGVTVTIGGVNVNFIVQTTISAAISRSSFSQSIQFRFSAMGVNHALGPHGVAVPFTTVASVVSAFTTYAATALANGLRGSLLGAGLEAFNWVRANVSQAVLAVTQFFQGAGATSQKIAEGTVAFMNATVSDAVRDLNETANESARILRASFSWTAAQTGAWLNDVGNFGDAAVNEALEAAGYAADEIADVMGTIFGGDWIPHFDLPHFDI